ncbi:MAG: DUF6036 family nucleotidyltransferase [Terriglobales bacterium]
MRRAQKIKIEGTAVRFATPEDLIVHKLVAGRPRDLEDAAYGRQWLQQFDRDLGIASLAARQELSGGR